MKIIVHYQCDRLQYENYEEKNIRSHNNPLEMNTFQISCME